MTRFISATYHSNLKAAEFIADDGRHLIRTGGSLPWRTHNIGNLMSPEVNGSPAPKKTKGYIGFAKPADSDHHFFIFPDDDTGRAQLKASLLRLHKDKPLDKLVAAYAPKHDGNDTAGYTRKLSKLTGIDTDCKVKDLSESQLESLIDGIARLEGYHADAETRKEVWVNVSHIQATDGARPIAGEEIVLRSNGKDTTLKSNDSGQFGAIPHGKEDVEVLHKTADGKLKKVGDLYPDKSQNWSLLTKLSEFFGSTASVEPPTDTPQKKQPVQYVVQSGDSLSKIAQRFNTTVADIKQVNRLTKDTIHPGQVLGIHGSPKKSAPEDQPKKAAPKPPLHANKPTPHPKTAQAAQAKTISGRSKQGAGEPLALLQPEEGIAPWMKHALDEAKQHHGAKESEIQKTINYHSEIHDDRTSMVGTNNAWCAAFANWCLLQAKYPIRNSKETGFADWSAAVMRADGFNQMHGSRTEKKQKYEDIPLIANPLYTRIKEPVYGAIAVVTSPAGVGKHVGFVYARESENHIILLGGNQNDQINFTSFNEKAVSSQKVVIGGKATKTKAEPNHLRFFIPNSYVEIYKKQSTKLESTTCAQLNQSIGIKSKNSKNGSSTR